MTRDSDSNGKGDVDTRSRGERRQLAAAFERLLRAVLERPGPTFARVRKLWLERDGDAKRDASEHE